MPPFFQSKMARFVKIAGYKVGAKKSPDGRLHFPNRKKIEQFTKSLGDGVRVVCEIREDESALVKSHKGYYFAVVVKHCVTALRDVCGYPVDPDLKGDLDLGHDWLKKEFLINSLEVKNNFGESITLPPSTTRLDDQGWKDYLTKIIVFAAEIWGYEIPVKMPKYSFPIQEPINFNR